jgi:serine/threonine protein kinase
VGTCKQEKDAQVIARQLLDALAYMHLNNVTHRDLKLVPPKPKNPQTFTL